MSGDSMNEASEARIAGIPIGSRVAYGTEHRRRGILVGWRSDRTEEHAIATIDNDYGFREDAHGEDVELAAPQHLDTSGPLYAPGGMLHLQVCSTRRVNEHQGVVCHCPRRAPSDSERRSW
jgi:hypothetical protein